MQLHPHHLPLLLHLTSCLGEAAAACTAAAARDAPAAAAEAADPAPAARSIIEGMLLPDTTAFATEFISQSWGYGRASLDADPGPKVVHPCSFLPISSSLLHIAASHLGYQL